MLHTCKLSAQLFFKCSQDHIYHHKPSLTEMQSKWNILQNI